MRLYLSLFLLYLSLFFLSSMYIWVPDRPKSPTALHTKVDYQVASLSSNQMGKENEHTFAKLSGAENYKEWAREMIFALKNSGLWGYVDSTITRPLPLALGGKELTVTAEAI